MAPRSLLIAHRVRPGTAWELAAENRVRELRRGAGLTQAELVGMMEVSRNTINSIENGRYIPSLPLALSLARHFRRRVEELLG